MLRKRDAMKRVLSTYRVVWEVRDFANGNIWSGLQLLRCNLDSRVSVAGQQQLQEAASRLASDEGAFLGQVCIRGMHPFHPLPSAQSPHHIAGGDCSAQLDAASSRDGTDAVSVETPYFDRQS